MKFTAKVLFITDQDGEYWRAHLLPKPGPLLHYDDCHGIGSTPEEAVARLKEHMKDVDAHADRIIEFEYGPPRNPARED